MPDLFGETPTIKAISLWQPWASLIAAGLKRHETRHWSTAYRGPIAIHASNQRAETVAGHLTRADLAAGNFTHGRFAWRIEDVQRLTRPIPTIGRQGLFNWPAPDDLEAHLGPKLNHAAAARIAGWAA